MDDFKSLSARLVEIACDMKIKDETQPDKTRPVKLSHYELCLLIDCLHVVEAVRAVAPQGRK